VFSKRLELAAVFCVCFALIVVSTAFFILDQAAPPWEDRVVRPFYIAQSGASPMAAGYSPSQIRAAYNLPSTGGNGTTIAIIDVYDQPNIQNDLTVFSSQFGLPLPTADNFQVHKMSPTLGIGDGSWVAETSLDVEWAHAIAPQANILLVEAVSHFDNDLLAAVDWARNQPGVAAVSMSWGKSEFSNEASFDRYFNSPSGVAFFAASGDSGDGVSWPACSAYVTSVGGTTLNLNGDGTVISEVGWSGSGGGVSSYLSRPAYQTAFGLGFNRRAVPDVSYNANPITGVSVYYGNSWHVLGGTSAGAPQWAAIQALGRSSTNSQFYTDARLPTNASYFRDIISGSNGAFTASTGYDLVTGLGSPLTVNFAPPPPPTNETSTVTLLPTGASMPLNGTNQFAVNYTLGGTPLTAYTSGGTLTLTIDLNTSLIVAGTSTGSNSQEKWVSSAEGNPVLGKNLTLAYSHILSQTAYYVALDGNPQKPNLTYVTAPTSATSTPTSLTATLGLSSAPQTVWALNGSNASVANPLSAGVSERWYTQTEAWQFYGPNVLPQPIIYRHQFVLNFTGVNATPQWYDNGSIAEVTLLGVFNRTSGTGQRVNAYTIDGTNQTQVQPTADIINFTIQMDSPHQISVNSTMQYQLTTSSGDLESVSAPSLAEDAGWYDMGTVVSAVFNYTWNAVANQSRQNALGYVLNQAQPTLLTRASNGTFTVQVTMNQPQSIAINSVTQYLVSYQFKDSVGSQTIVPSGAKVQLNSSTVVPLAQSAFWVDSGSQVQIYSVTWQGIDVTPAVPNNALVTAPLSATVLCRIFTATLRVQTSAGNPVSGAQVSITLANQTALQFTTGSDGTVSLSLIPRGAFNSSITYQGQITLVNGDASINPLTIVTVSAAPTATPSPTSTPKPTPTATTTPSTTPTQPQPQPPIQLPLSNRPSRHHLPRHSLIL
jgi:subtilase family serine protease